MEDTKEDYYYYKEGPPGIGKDDDGAMAVQHKLVLDSSSKGSMMVAAQCPSFSETSSLFSTVDCSSFSSRSDTSSFVKEDISLVVPPLNGASSSIEFKDSLSKAAATGYFEFSFLKGRLVEDEEEEEQEGSLAADGVQVPDSTQSDAFERLPVRTERTRYCSEDVHTRVNPCFEKTGDTLESRATRSKKLTRSLGSVLSKHLALSPGPAFRRSSCERFSSRIVLDHPSSPSSSDKLYAPTPLRRFGAACLNSSSDNDRLSISSTVSRTERAKLKLEWLASRKTYYTVSPNHRKSLGGCLGGPRTLPEQDYRGPLCLAAEDSLHGGKNRCLPSPRLSFGHGKALAVFKQEQAESSLSMVVPSSSVRGQLHCLLRGDLPSFTFLIDGSDEVLVAKAIKPASETGNLLYMFYSWKPRGRARGSWKGWMRRDRTVPDFLGQMTVASKLVPASRKDGDEMHELEFVVRDQRGACSPRLSFSTWETDSSPVSSRSPLYSFPSPFCITTPSPCRLPSSRYVSLSMVPVNPASPRLEKECFGRRSRFRPHLSPLKNRARSDDERSSSFQDAWSDTDVPEMETTSEVKELAALVMRIPTSANGKLPGILANINQAWERANKPVKAAAGTSSSKRSSLSSCRRLGRVQSTETKENDQKKADSWDSNRTKDAAAPKSFKLRDLMGVKPDFGKQQQRQEAAAKVTVILPAGNHGVPIQGNGGPEPLVDRWRSGGRCDCGSWDLGCGLTILEGEISDQQQQKNSSSLQQQQGESTIHIFSQGKPAMSLAALDDGISSVCFQAPMSYLQAFASAVVVLYTKGPAATTTTASSSFRKSSPRFPLRPLVADPGYYCSPPPASLLDRL